MPQPFYEHHEPLMVPYNFDISGFSAPAGFGGEFHPSLPIGHEHTAALHANGALGAETNTVISNVTGGAAAISNSPGLSAYATVGKSNFVFWKSFLNSCENPSGIEKANPLRFNGLSSSSHKTLSY